MKQIKTRFSVSIVCLSIFIGLLFPSAGATDTCEKWLAKVVSVKGKVQVRRAGELSWVAIKMDDTFRSNDMIRAEERSRANLILCDGSNFPLDQNTTITFPGLEREETLLIRVLKGAAYFFSRIPRRLKLLTPFVNGDIEGTEFYVRVEQDQTLISIFEGNVRVENEAGSLVLASGQSAIGKEGKAPELYIVARPRDAVRWALYYPPILDYRATDFPGGTETDWQGIVRKSIEFYWKGELVEAFSSIEGVPDDIGDPRFFTYRAGLLLTVGRFDEGGEDIKRALDLDSSNSHAYALQSIISLVQNEKKKALNLAEKAKELGPESSAARVALSYAQQAHFDLQGALKSLQEAVELDPENFLAWARLAELWLSVGDLNQALKTAQKAVALNPNLARTQTVLGFAYLTQVKTKDAKKAFEKAIQLDNAAPLARLGLGLAKIREGDLKEGRVEIEIAASLDPNNSLIRSYMGKAYFEEKRDKHAMSQLAIAKELDPLDPTPYFYDAIRKQTINRPVEALHDLQKSIELNDNRAVYRSKLMLDEDLAARSASLGRIYGDLGFQHLALVEGWKSVNTDPANYSAHRFLADSYSALPRHEIARVSELLQSQLLQPINITPIQPLLGESDPLILEGAGPANPAFNEFNPLFLRNRFALQASGVGGGNDTLGGELVHSAVLGRWSYSLGLFNFKTDGFRENNDLNWDIYNVFVQTSLSHKTSIQAEIRKTDTEKGDLQLRFDPDNFTPTLRQDERLESGRFGFHHAFSPRSDLIGSFIYQDADFDSALEVEFTVPLPPPLPPMLVQRDIDLKTDEEGYITEVQHLFRHRTFSLISGVGHFAADSKTITTITTVSPPPTTTTSTTEESDIRHSNLYVYSLINYPETFTWTVGGSADFYEEPFVERDQINPKFGLTWNLTPATTLRAAVFSTLKRRLISNQTIEPTQVAGFNQFFDDVNGSHAWRYGIAIDQKFSKSVYGGVEYSEREMEIPYQFSPPPSPEIREADWEERVGRAYLYWTPLSWLTAGGEYQYERNERGDFGGPELVTSLTTHNFVPSINLFHPSGFTSRLRLTYTDQKGTFGSPVVGVPNVQGDDAFWVVGVSIGYRLPERYGLISLEARNLFDEQFNYQDMDQASPRIYPERLIFGRITLAF
jgi:tetratricopeptide (TPR) repeat protein